MSRRLINAIVFLGFCLGLSSAAYAQVKDNLELNVFGGGSLYTAKSYEIGPPQSAVPVSGRFRFDHAIRAGLRVGVYSRGHWSQEFFYTYEPNKAHFIRRTAPTSSVDLSMQLHNYGITALYYLNDNESRSVRPFLSFGLGGSIYRLTPEARAFANDPLRGNLADMNTSHEIALNYGVGLKTRTSDWLGFRADIRGFLNRTPSFGLARRSDDATATVFPVSGPLHNAEASVGLVFYFYGKR